MRSPRVALEGLAYPNFTGLALEAGEELSSVLVGELDPFQVLVGAALLADGQVENAIGF